MLKSRLPFVLLRSTDTAPADAEKMIAFIRDLYSEIYESDPSLVRDFDLNIYFKGGFQ